MLAPDINITYPWNTQGYNRYGYALDNPLKYIDPTGETFHSWNELYYALGKLMEGQYGGSATGAGAGDINYYNSNADAMASVYTMDFNNFVNNNNSSFEGSSFGRSYWVSVFLV